MLYIHCTSSHTWVGLGSARSCFVFYLGIISLPSSVQELFRVCLCVCFILTVLLAMAYAFQKHIDLSHFFYACMTFDRVSESGHFTFKDSERLPIINAWDDHRGSRSHTLKPAISPLPVGVDWHFEWLKFYKPLCAVAQRRTPAGARTRMYSDWEPAAGTTVCLICIPFVVVDSSDLTQFVDGWCEQIPFQLSENVLMSLRVLFSKRLYYVLVKKWPLGRTFHLNFHFTDVNLLAVTRGMPVRRACCASSPFLVARTGEE